MENSFLFKISKQLLRNYVISDLVIVLPSRRSSVFLKKEIAKLISKPTWLPRIYSIDDFIFEVNNCNSASSLELFFSFYDAYTSIVKKPHNLERCFKWAHGLLEDFNEIDKAYTCPTEIFSYLHCTLSNIYVILLTHQSSPYLGGVFTKMISIFPLP